MRPRLLATVGPVAAVAAVTFGATSNAHATERPSARLVYVRGAGADGCPDEAGVRSAVAARLGYDPFTADASKTIAVAVVRPGSSFQAKIEVRDASGASKGTRRLDSKATECAELAGAITLAISIAIDPFGAGGSAPLPLPAVPDDGQGGDPTTSSSSSSSSSTGFPASSATVDASSEAHDGAVTTGGDDLAGSPSGQEDASTPRVLAGGGVVSSLGYEPGIGVGATAGLALRWSRASIGIEGRADLPGEKALAIGGAVRSSVIVASLLPCAHRGIVLVCASGTVGAIRSSGTGFAARSQSDPYVAAGARLGLEVPFGGSVLGRFTFDIAATVLGARLRYGDPPSDVWQSPPLCGALGGAIVGAF